MISKTSINFPYFACLVILMSAQTLRSTSIPTSRTGPKSTTHLRPNPSVPSTAKILLIRSWFRKKNKFSSNKCNLTTQALTDPTMTIQVWNFLMEKVATWTTVSIQSFPYYFQTAK